jgi:predicted esterase
MSKRLLFALMLVGTISAGACSGGSSEPSASGGMPSGGGGTGGAAGHTTVTGDGGASAGGPGAGRAGSSGAGGASPAGAGGGGSAGASAGGAGGAARDAGATDASSGDVGGTTGERSARSAGCGKARTGTSTFVRQPTMRIGSSDRSYFTYVPSNYDPNKAYPLLFTFHGAYGPDTDPAVAGGTPPIVNATKNDAIVVAPNGVKQPAVSNTTGWDLKTTSQDLAFVQAMIDKLEQDYCVDTDRIFSHGFSMGGGFSLLVGCALGDVVRGIAVIEGGFRAPDVVPPASACVGHAAAWVVQGSQDATVPPLLAQQAREQLYLPRHQCAKTTKPVPPSPCAQFDGCMAGYPQVLCATNSGHDPQDALAVPGAWNFLKALPSVAVP